MYLSPPGQTSVSYVKAHASVQRTEEKRFHFGLMNRLQLAFICHEKSDHAHKNFLINF